MAERDAQARFRPQFFLKSFLIWMASAGVLLLLFGLLLSRTAATERTLAYFSAALAFLAACTAGAYASGKGRKLPFVCGLVNALVILGILLLLGFLISRKDLAKDSVLSLVSFTLAGSLFGSVCLGGRSGRRRNRRSFHPSKTEKRKR